MVYQNLALLTFLLNFWGICSDPFTTATLLNPKLSFLKNTTYLKNMTANAQLNEREKMQNNFSLQKSEYLKGDALKYPKFGQKENHISYTGRSKREIINLALMIRCATNCLAVSYKGYGCYCGFYGGGTPVDEIDKCCQQHDDCYGASGCDGILGLGIPAYITPYTWRCSSERPYCEKASDSCGDCLCECDRKFSMCIRKYPCPTSRPLCKTRSWGYGVFQSILMWLPSN